MRRFVLLLLLVLFGVGTAVAYVQKTYMVAYDLNTPPTAATAGAVLGTTNLLNTTVYQSIAGQPDTPRNVVMVIVDTTPSINAGTVTIAGKDVNGTAQTEAISISAGAGTYTGTKVFSGPVTFTTANVAVLGGAGDETIAVGSGSVVAPVYCATPPIGRLCGFSDSDGWVSTDSMKAKLFHIEVGALTATGGVSWQVECRGSGGNHTPKLLLTGSLTAAVAPGVPSTASAATFPITEDCADVRVGLKYGTTDTAGTDSVSAYLAGETR